MDECLNNKKKGKKKLSMAKWKMVSTAVQAQEMF